MIEPDEESAAQKAMDLLRVALLLREARASVALDRDDRAQTSVIEEEGGVDDRA